MYVDISPQRATRVVADVGVDNKEAIEKLNCELATIDNQKQKFLDLMAVLNIKRRRIEHKIYELRVEQEQALLFVCRIPVVRVRVGPFFPLCSECVLFIVGLLTLVVHACAHCKQKTPAACGQLENIELSRHQLL